MLRSDTRASVVVACTFAALGSWPCVAGSYGLDLVAGIMISAILALSLELLVGATGLVCFGQAAFFGIGAYAAALLSKHGAPSLWVSAPLCSMAAAAYALMVGALALRTRGVYFIMTTLAFAQLAYFVVHDTPLGGGTDGIYLEVKASTPASSQYFVILVCLAGTYLGLAQLLRSNFGRALAGIRDNEQRMRAAGFATHAYKLAVFTLAGGIAGLAGFLLAIKDGFVNPELLSWHVSGAVLAMIVLGGLGQLRGALIGAFAFALLEELFKSEALFGGFSRHWHLGVGLTIMLCVALCPAGLVELPSWLREGRQKLPPPGESPSSSATATRAEAPGGGR